MGKKTPQRFTATYIRKSYVQRNGQKKGNLKYLLYDVRNANSGKLFRDHLWVQVNRELKSLNLNKGDRIIFSAVVKQYEKGYRGKDLLSRLNHPVKKQLELVNITDVDVVQRNCRDN